MIQSRAEQSRAEQSRAEQSRAEQAHNYNLVDLGKWVMAIFVVALHGHPFVDIILCKLSKYKRFSWLG